jgi:hypothetical protein
MIKKLPLTGEHYELGYGNIIKKNTWLFMNEKGNLKEAPFEGLGDLGSVEEYRTVGIGKTTPDEAKKNPGPSLDGKGKYNLDDDITENMLRKEHKLRLRGVYQND